MRISAYIVTKERSLAPDDAQQMSDDWFFDHTARRIKVTSAAPEEVERALRPLELQPHMMRACTNPQPLQVKVAEKGLFMAIIEMLTGQFYLAAFVARLVGIMGAGQTGSRNEPWAGRGP